MLYTPAVKRRRSSMFVGCWWGPHTVVANTSPVNYCIQLIALNTSWWLTGIEWSCSMGTPVSLNVQWDPHKRQQSLLQHPLKNPQWCWPSVPYPSYADIFKGPPTSAEATSSEERLVNLPRPQHNQGLAEHYGLLVWGRKDWWGDSNVTELCYMLLLLVMCIIYVLYI